jgi:hypothetical protein
MHGHHARKLVSDRHLEKIVWVTIPRPPRKKLLSKAPEVRKYLSTCKVSSSYLNNCGLYRLEQILTNRGAVWRARYREIGFSI